VKPVKQGLPWVAPLFATLLFCPPARASGAENVRHVLVLYPVSDRQPGNVLVEQGLRHAFDAPAAERVELYNEYLDLARFPDDRYQRQLAEFLRQKYDGRKIDVVIPVMAPALDFALKYREEVVPGVPMVFAAIDEREVKARALGPDVVGVPMRMDLVPTLELALRLHPGARRVVVIAGASKMDAYWEAEARQAFRDREGKLQLVYLTGLPVEDLLKEVADLSDGSLIYYLHVQKDGSGHAFAPADVAERVAAAAQVPVYGHIDSYLGRGIVGGCLMSFEAEGRNAARLALRILAGEKPESMSFPDASENACMFDGRQLQRWGINEADLPPGSVVRFRQPTFWDAYKWHAIGALALCVSQALLILALLVQRASRRRTTVALGESEQRFRRMADTAPVMIWVSGADKRCTYFNKPWLDFTGRPVESQLGDGWREGVHAADLQSCLDAYTRAFDARQAFRVEYQLRRFDGEYRWVLNVGAPRFASDGAFQGYIGSCLDITEQKQVEGALRESQNELRALAGRLFQAQETERRRIARELHDDLQQSLALLAVELDLLGQAPPEPAARLGGRMSELSARVKQLSSAVHDLSHNLHPSRLEQLGLVAGVRGLCKEHVQAHGLEVEFAPPKQIPPSLPDDTTLCLYRIAQEALRNVIKHSGARHARVELSGSEGEVSLQVADDGAGFDPAAIDGKGGLGLVSMRERLRLVGGAIIIDSRPSAGTRIDVRVPLCATGQGPNARPENPGQAEPPVI
jgi:PAS domain S-box-containing protein